jgi:ribonuclease HI
VSRANKRVVGRSRPRLASGSRSGAAGESDFTVVFDGGSLGNPGRGYGSYRVRRRGADWMPPVRLECGENVTNNEAEYRSLIAGLAEVAAQSGEPGRASVEVLGDSQLVVNQLKGVWKVRADNLRPLSAEALALLGRFQAVRLIWHPRAASVVLLGH